MSADMIDALIAAALAEAEQHAVVAGLEWMPAQLGPSAEAAEQQSIEVFAGRNVSQPGEAALRRRVSVELERGFRVDHLDEALQAVALQVSPALEGEAVQTIIQAAGTRNGEMQQGAGLQDAAQFTERSPRIGKVFKDKTGQSQVENLIGERQAFGVGQGEPGVGRPLRRCRVGILIHAKKTQMPESRIVDGSGPATEVEHARSGGQALQRKMMVKWLRHQEFRLAQRTTIYGILTPL